jgi:hypothetical protein
MGNSLERKKWHVCKPSEVGNFEGQKMVKKWKCTKKAFVFDEAVKLASDRTFFNPLGEYDYRLFGSSGPFGLFTPLPNGEFEIEE